MNPNNGIPFNIYVKQRGYAQYNRCDTLSASSPNEAVERYLERYLERLPPNTTPEKLHVIVQEAASRNAANLYAYTLTKIKRPTYNVKQDKLLD